MAELRKITKSAPLSGFSQVGPQGGSAFLAFADMANQAYQFLKPAAMEQMAQEGAAEGAELARRQIGQNGFPVVPKAQPTSAGGDLSGFSPDTPGQSNGLLGLIDRTEGGGNYSTLFGHSQREGGAFAGVDVSKMSIGEVLDFTKPTGAYAQWVAKQVGRVATPTGRFQIVGSTLRNAVKALGLATDAAFDATTQDKIAGYLAANRLRSASTPEGKRKAMRAEWEGFKHVPDAELDRAIAEFEGQGSSIGRDASEFTQGAAPSARPEAKPDQMNSVQDSAVEALAPETPPTLVRTSEGKIEPRMFSPLSGEILQAHRAAASTAYLSEMLVKGGTDMMSLSENFIGNPDGFQQAAQSYIDGVVESAPAVMKGDLRMKLTQDVSRRYMGMVEEHQRDVRQRANNSSRALTERYANDYAEAMAAGNFDEAAAARGSLEEILTARESLPGVAWTREQSENVILGAQDTAARIAEQNRTKLKSEQAGTLRTIIKAAENGQTAADEAILDDPSVLAANPELAAEAAAKVALRDFMPGFFSLPPDEMDAMIAEQRAVPIEEGWQVDIPGAMQTARNAAVAALEKDPIAYAQERLPQKPPALDDFSPEAPERFVTSMEARRDYANGMVEQGYTDAPAFLSNAEIESLSGAMSKSSPPEIRAALAGAIVSGFGEDAPTVFKALKVDAVTSWGGALMAKGGSGALAAEAIQGQAIIDENQAQLPPEAEWRTKFQSEFREVMADLPVDSVQAEADLMKFAKAIYANRAAAPGFEADEATMTEAIQAALGQTTDPRGEPVGGVQSLFGQKVLMPVGQNATRVQKAFEKGMMEEVSAGQAFGSIFGGLDASYAPAFWSRVSVQPNGDGTFTSGGVPRIGGEPLPLSMISNGDVRFVPIGGTQYRMEVKRSGATLDVHTPEGSLYIVDFARLK